MKSKTLFVFFYLLDLSFFVLSFKKKEKKGSVVSASSLAIPELLLRDLLRDT